MSVRHNIIMRGFFFSLMCLGFFFTQAQNSSQSAEHLFCGESISIPNDCHFKETYTTYNGEKLRTGAEINNDDQFVHWTYFNHIPDPVKKDFTDQYLTQLLSHFEKKSDGYEKKQKSFISFDQELSGWLIEINNKEKKNTSFIYATGVINDQHVMIYCGLKKKPKKNKDLPDYMSQIIRFK